MEDKYFNFTDVLNFGWAVCKANIGFFIGIGFTWLVLSYTPSVIIKMLPRLITHGSSAYYVLYWAITVMGWGISIVLGIGLTKIALSFCDEQRPEFSTLFDAHGCFWRFVGVTVLYLLIVYVGLILFIVPGVIWGIKFKFCQYFVIDKGLGPIEALKASARTTMGVKLELFGFWFMCAMIVLAGMLCLLVGVFAAYPTIIVANALLYRQLLAQTPELAEFGIGETDVQSNQNGETSADEQDSFSHLQ